MSELFDPAEFLVLPGTGGSTATTRSTLEPCPQCGEEVFEVVLKPNGRYSIECPACCADGRTGRRVGSLVGAVNMRTGKTKEVDR